jgi:LacI family transcriptional regulator
MKYISYYIFKSKAGCTNFALIDYFCNMKSITLSDIAAKCGCSVTTVSRVINGQAGRYRIARQTVERVMAEVTACGYIPPFTVQSLRHGGSGIIGLLLPSIANPYFADMAGSIIPDLYKSGYTTLLMDTMEDAARLNEAARNLLLRRVEGIIAVPCGDDPEILEQIAKDVPVVLIDRYYENSDLPYVTTNNFKGGYDAARILIAAGHERITCIQGERDSMPNKERVKGYLKAMEEAGLSEYARVAGNEFSVQNGYLETKVLMSGAQAPTAIFALSNTILLGSLHALRESQKEVPDDVSLVSFDDNMYMDYLTPSITRIGQPVDNMAKLAVKILCDKLMQQDIKAGNSQIRLTPSIIPGNSVAGIR